MPKFTIEEHEKRMRDILKPKPKIEGRGLLDRLLAEARRRRTPKPPGVKTV